MKILFFDTETTGLDADYNVMLQLAWQLVDTDDWTVLSSHNCYFKWPSDWRKVSSKAIQVNGLTEEVLEEKGTMRRDKAIRLFAKDMMKADACAAHNIHFDMDFVSEADTKCIIEWPSKQICTMLSTTNLCAIPFPNSYSDDYEYKWPKLSELARFLNIETEDIEFHNAAADVEVTKRCLKVLLEKYW